MKGKLEGLAKLTIQITLSSGFSVAAQLRLKYHAPSPHRHPNSDDPEVLRMPYWLPQLITFLVAVMGAFYKDVQKKVNDVPVYWHRLPVLTPLGWLLLIAFMISLGLSILQAHNAARGKQEEKDKAEALEKTLKEVRADQASSLAYQIERFKEILDSQKTIGDTTIGRISTASDELTNNINDSTGRLSGSIDSSSTTLQGNISQSSTFLRTNILEAALSARSSVPRLKLSITKKGVVHDFGASEDERTQAMEKSNFRKQTTIGFLPKSARDVLFPFADNTARNVYAPEIGSINFKFSDEFADDHAVRPLGFVESPGTFAVVDSAITRMDTEVNENGLFLTFGFDKPWEWEVMHASLKSKFAEGKYIVKVYRYHVPIAPPRAPAFNATLEVQLSDTLRIFMPLEIRNYLHTGRSYSYELCISKPPEIRTDYQYLRPDRLMFSQFK